MGQHWVCLSGQSRPAESSTPQNSLSHWPTVEAWWRNRLAAKELCDLLFIPITWAGTFVLAALTFVFPGTHFVLLDCDCIPVTLFEVADLWKDVSLIRNPCEACPLPVSPATDALADLTESAPKASKVGKKDHQHMQIGQGILLVTEHNAEINAGFIVVFGSQPAPPVGETQWNQSWNEHQRPRLSD